MPAIKIVTLDPRKRISLMKVTIKGEAGDKYSAYEREDGVITLTPLRKGAQ